MPLYRARTNVVFRWDSTKHRWWFLFFLTRIKPIETTSDKLAYPFWCLSGHGWRCTGIGDLFICPRSLNSILTCSSKLSLNFGNFELLRRWFRKRNRMKTGGIRTLRIQRKQLFTGKFVAGWFLSPARLGLFWKHVRMSLFILASFSRLFSQRLLWLIFRHAVRLLYLITFSINFSVWKSFQGRGDAAVIQLSFTTPSTLFSSFLNFFHSMALYQYWQSCQRTSVVWRRLR